MATSKTVYVINKSSHDYSEAERFGELIFLSKGRRNKLAVASMYREFEESLKHSEPTDYILTSGLTIMNIIACAIFALKHKRLNLLIFHVDERNKDGYYKMRTINFEEERYEEDEERPRKRAERIEKDN